MKQNIQVTKIARHRNGVMGAPFYAVLFKDKEYPQYTFIASVFDSVDEEISGAISVFAIEELVAGNIEFANGNSWRGDYYESSLREAIKQQEEKERQADAEKAERVS